eukprot:sb/3477380/
MLSSSIKLAQCVILIPRWQNVKDLTPNLTALNDVKSKAKQSRTARINPVPGVLISSLQRSRAHTPQHTHSVLLSGLSREPLPIIAWWTRRHALDQNRTRYLVRERRVY